MSAFQRRVWSRQIVNGISRLGPPSEIQTDDLNGNKRSIGANLDCQCDPRFESTGRR
jgi:hypothetical protein